jgi:hypothetical protein
MRTRADGADAWASDLLYGAEPCAAPATETLTADDQADSASDAAQFADDQAPPTKDAGQTVDLDDAEPPPCDVNAGAKKTAVLLGAALVLAVAVIVAALLTFSDAPPPAARPVSAAAASAVPVPTNAAPQSGQEQAVPFTASANCPAGSSSAEALTDSSSDSAWVCVRGALGAEVDGQVLHVDFGRSYVLSAVSVTPGWVAKTPGGKEEWPQHRVVTRLQYLFNDTDRTIFTQDTGTPHGPVTTPLPNKVLASRVTVVILATARPPASPLPARDPGAAGQPGFGDSLLGPDAAPVPPEVTAAAEPGPPAEPDSDPADATFAMSALKFFGHQPN